MALPGSLNSEVDCFFVFPHPGHHFTRCRTFKSCVLPSQTPEEEENEEGKERSRGLPHEGRCLNR